VTFLLLALVVIVTPGPDFALTVRNTAARGRGGGVATALGVVTGQSAWALATAAGVAAVLLASQQVFTVLRIAGALYLVWLGVSSLRAAWRGSSHRAPRRLPVRSAYAQGLLSNLSNPKMPVFFTSLLPQFGASFAALAAHGLAFAALTLAWLALVARVGSRIRLGRVVDAVTGFALTALGLDLAASRR
jgi:threonine/homoserine/homoserine lactone efflux protein